MLKFVLPNKHNRDDVISFYDQIAHSGGVCIGFQNYKDYDGWLVGMQNRHTGKKLPISYSTRKKMLLSNDIGSGCRIGWIELMIKRENAITPDKDISNSKNYYTYDIKYC